MNVESRPITAAGWAMLHRIADGDTDVLARLLGYFRDPDADDGSERWQFLRLAETNAWKAVELLLLRRMIEGRFGEGKLDAWVETTPLGQEIRDILVSFFDSHRFVEFPSEPANFGAFAFQELRAARLAGELHAEVRDPASNPEEIMKQMAARVAGGFPLLAQAIRLPKLDLAGMTWAILDLRIRFNFETLVALPTSRTPPSNPGLEDLVVLFINCPSRIDELLGDIYADGEFIRRVNLAEMRKGNRDQRNDDLKQKARAEVKAMLGRSVPIVASTLVEAIAEAERLQADHDILVAINSLWNWFQALPAQEQEKIGTFTNARQFWIKARFRSRLQ